MKYWCQTQNNKRTVGLTQTLEDITNLNLDEAEISLYRKLETKNNNYKLKITRELDKKFYQIYLLIYFVYILYTIF